MANFEKALVKVLAEEGGSKYTETKGDAGGATKYGISQKAFPNLNIRELTLDKAAEIYRSEYWEAIKGDLIASQKVAECIFDCAVNTGVKKASILIQESVYAKVDGVIGSRTITLINASNESAILFNFTQRRINYYNQIVAKNPSQAKFINGWTARAKRYEK